VLLFISFFAISKPGVCARDRCATKVNVISSVCQFCKLKFCLAHGLAEVHGCGAEAKKHARQTWIQQHQTPPSKPMNAQKRAYLKRRLKEEVECGQYLFVCACSLFVFVCVCVVYLCLVCVSVCLSVWCMCMRACVCSLFSLHAMFLLLIEGEEVARRQEGDRQWGQIVLFLIFSESARTRAWKGQRERERERKEVAREEVALVMV
jgi:AN1-like Zinc finger